ncbi:Hydrogenase isoenzymes formation protein HypC [Stieleria neptunia]|uniref:Hydrogenase isoenzymes formation protein HypC n=2 Tax=Stieleria neptunia TaxID=2527979 RepID=A0A518HIS9_9BACT|nr:Hydrogenase isoenzymes formation protein HypC [Stieleria neptunia]
MTVCSQAEPGNKGNDEKTAATSKTRYAGRGDAEEGRSRIDRTNSPQQRCELMCLAVPGKVESIFDENQMRMGKVNFGGVVKEVCLAFLPDIEVGEYAIVHAGFAISQIDEASAEETLRTFDAMERLDS